MALQDAPPDEGFRPIVFGDDPARAYEAALLPGTSYAEGLPTPDELLGRPWGTRLASHDEIVAALETWAGLSERASLETFGATFEGRPLVRMVITSPANHARLDELKAAHARLADPRELSEADGRALLDGLPANVWLGYGIHGDETSGPDAAPVVAYHLLACLDDDVEALLDEVVIVLDPCLNPDGRERIRAMTRWNSGYRNNQNHESLHRGRWPYGRGNHYLFDMNRDWMAGVCPETRARWAVLREFPPQLFIDGHEMSGLDTFLFYPQSKPHNHQLSAKIIEWQGTFADDAARAFDRHAWGYYTREWADAWYPGYSDSWGSLNGAIGILYEQGSVGGQALRRESGEVVSYREAVHGQVVISLANLATLRANRGAILEDYAAFRRGCVDAEREGAERCFVFVGDNTSRTARFVASLLGQGIEVKRAEGELETSAGHTTLGGRFESRTFPPGSWVVPSLQPQSRLVHAYLDIDPRMDDETVADERGRLERGDSSRLYDVTAWDLGRQYDLDGAWCTPASDAELVAVASAEQPAGEVRTPGGQPAYAWAVSAADDRVVEFAARALELGLAVHASDRDFSVVGSDGETIPMPRGSLVLRRHENSEPVDGRVLRAAEETGAMVVATATGRGQGEHPDLGGGHFELLARPRVAILSGNPVSSGDFGHLWHYLDAQLGIAATLLEARGLGGYDLRRYNVIVIPPARGMGGVLESAGKNLKTWVEGGGTLIACGSAAAGLTGKELGLTSVVRRRDALEELDAYAAVATRQLDAREIEIDFDALWDVEADGEPTDESSSDESSSDEDPDDAEGDGSEGDETADGGESDAKSRDAWMRRFMPVGVQLRGIVDEHHWLTSGARSEMSVPFAGATVLLSRGEVPVRLATTERIRMGGLLWPEARERLALSAWMTRESRGRGQVILFAYSPVFRGSHRGTARLFGNAVVLGPGLGADQPMDW